MSAWLWLRLVKWVAVTVFAAGLWVAAGDGAVSARRRAAWWVATPALLVAWIAGFGLTRHTGVSLGSHWVLGGMATSLLALQAVVWGVERADRPLALVRVVAVAATLACVALMVVRPGGQAAPTAAAEVAP